MTSTVPKAASTEGLRAALVVAAAASAGAGLVHAAAAGSHSGGGSLVWLFAACAAAQLGWAALVLFAPRVPVLVLGAGINGAAVAAWFLSRTVGLPIIDALADAEPIGTQDLVAAILGAIAVGAAVLVLAQPYALRSMPSAWSAMVVVGVVALVVPAMAVGHSHAAHNHAELALEHVHAGGVAHEHGSGGHHHASGAVTGHDHDSTAHDAAAHDASNHDASNHDSSSHAAHDSSDHAHLVSTDPSGDGHTHDPGPSGHQHDPSDPAHDPGTTPTGHDHGPGDPHPADTPHDHQSTDPTQPSGPHDHPSGPTGPIVSLDDPRLTPAQQAAGRNLLNTSLQAMAAFPTVDAVTAAGYQSIGDGSSGFEHFVNWSYFYDGIELDPSRIESIVIKIGPNGEKTVASAMYILNLGKTMADVPDIAGELTEWHIHTNLCWVPNGQGGMRLSGTTDASGRCAVGDNVVTPPMLHVWLTPQTCGPFAGIEALQGGACGAHHH